MLKYFKIFLWVFTQWCFLDCYAESSIHKKMYFELKDTDFSACVRRFNGTHQFGCSSDINGNVGILHFIHNSSDITWVLNNTTRGSYIVILPLDMFNRDLMVKLNSSSIISGVMINKSNQKTYPVSFSNEDTCPNRYTSFIPDKSPPEYACSSNPWNTYGTSMLQDNWNFPIVYLRNDTIVEKLFVCYQQNNLPLSVHDDYWHSLCALELQMGMSGTINTEVCMRRSTSFYDGSRTTKQCDPLGGRNIVYSVNKLSESQKSENKSIILVTTRLDSKSMFDGIVPGALSTATGIVTLLSTAQLLTKLIAKMPKDSSPKYNVLFLFLDGEAYDYIGSTKVIYDIQNGVFPKENIGIKEENIKLIVDLFQINSINNIGIHFNKNDTNVEDFATDFKKYALKNNINSESSGPDAPPLIPSSILNFQNKLKSISSLVLTSSAETTNYNRYYHSIFDDENSVNYKFGEKGSTNSLKDIVGNVSLTLAQSLLNQMYFDIQDDVFPSVNLNISMVDEMLSCYIISQNCSLFTHLTGYVDNIRPTYYVGIQDYKRYLVTATGILLANLTGSVTNMNKVECKAEINKIYNIGTSDNQNYFWIITNNTEENSGYCNMNLVNFTAASSPAFMIDKYNWRSNEFPTWTESVWNGLGVQMFLQPSPHYEKLVFITGIFVFLLSFAIVIPLKKHVKSLVAANGSASLGVPNMSGS